MSNAKVIIVSNQKGGIGKTFTVCTMANLLSTDSNEKVRRYDYRRKAEKVLVVDTDFQGNATRFLTGKDQNEFNGAGLMEAINVEDAREYIHKVNDNLYILPATASVSQFDSIFTLNEDKIENAAYLLSRTLETVKDQFDWILVDTSPSLSKMTLQALNINFGEETHVLLPMQTEDFGLDSVHKFSNTMSTIFEETNPNLRLLGIVPILTDANMSVDQEIISEAKEAFGEYVFEAVIKRRATLKKMVRDGFSEQYSEQRRALKDYYDLLNEVKKRVC
jgi:chromosome partitioning protein